MNDIVERLRSSVMWYSANAETVMEAAAEIERLRSRLEIDPSHPYDGIYARDETIRGLEKQISSLLNLLADARTESMRLRAALREILGWHDYSNDMHKPIEVRAAYMRARAALEGRT